MSLFINLITPSNFQRGSSGGIRYEADIYEANLKTSNGHYTTSEFATVGSSNINVYFKGSPSDAIVTLEKQNLFRKWNVIDSFNPNDFNNYFKEMTGKAGTYRVKIDSSSGAEISGHIRVNQL